MKRSLKAVMSLLIATVMLITMQIPAFAATASVFANARAWKSKENYLKNAKVVGYYTDESQFDGYCILVMDCGLDKVDQTIGLVDDSYDLTRIMFGINVYVNKDTHFEAWTRFDARTEKWVTGAYVSFTEGADTEYKPDILNQAYIFSKVQSEITETFGIKLNEKLGYEFDIPSDSKLLKDIYLGSTNSIQLFVYEDTKCVYRSEWMTVTPQNLGLDWMDDGNKTSLTSLSFGKISDKGYSGKAITPDVTIKDGKYTLRKGTDYTLIYKNNVKVGTGTVTVRGVGNYSGTKTLKFNIVLKKPTLKVGKTSSGAKLTWNKVAGAAGYQIWLSTGGGKFKKVKTVTGTSFNLPLDSGKTYGFKIRAYKAKDDEMVYSSYSEIKTVKR